MIRTRFAPSPTGQLHLGGLRTALYNYLYAKKHGGQFIVRIEDTDQQRLVPGTDDQLLNDLKWAGLVPDQSPHHQSYLNDFLGPFHQSQRLALYRSSVQHLVEQGHAYRCFCTKDRLDAMRQHQQRIKDAVTPLYDRHCLHLNHGQVSYLLAAGTPHIIRLRMPEGQTTVHDLVKGQVVFKHAVMDDQVLMKSDGWPTYHLANVVDDHLMRISHVFRGEEWLTSTPKHLVLYNYFGWKPPQFAHLPLLLNHSDRSKLSKRQSSHVADRTSGGLSLEGATRVSEYQAAGYLPEALLNFVAMLGWAPPQPGVSSHSSGEQLTQTSILSLPELIQEFSTEGLTKQSVAVDFSKLKLFGRGHMQRLLHEDPRKLTVAVRKYSHKLDMDVSAFDDAYIQQAIALNQTRLTSLGDVLLRLGRFFFAPPLYETPTAQSMRQKTLKGVLQEQLVSFLSQLEAQIPSQWPQVKVQQDLLKWLEPIAKQHGLSVNEARAALRLALTGWNVGPPLFDAMHLLGRDEITQRLAHARQFYSQEQMDAQTQEATTNDEDDLKASAKK